MKKKNHLQTFFYCTSKRELCDLITFSPSLSLSPLYSENINFSIDLLRCSSTFVGRIDELLFFVFACHCIIFNAASLLHESGTSFKIVFKNFKIVPNKSKKKLGSKNVQFDLTRFKPIRIDESPVKNQLKFIFLSASIKIYLQ